MKQNDSDAGIPVYCVTPEDESGYGLLKRYLGRRQEELTQLRAALACGDYDLIRRVGHNLQGSGAAYDLVRVSALGAQIERAAERCTKSGVAQIIAELEQFINSITIVEPS